MKKKIILLLICDLFRTRYTETMVKVTDFFLI